MQEADKIVLKKIPAKYYDKNGSMDLDSCYQQTVAELGLQQSKRDQIIAFYLTILGLVIPSVISLEVADGAKAAAFFAMYGIGAMFCHVVIRYRIYKEVYWIACRVLAQMCNITEEGRIRDHIYALFFNCLKENQKTIVIKNKNGKNSLLRSFKRQLNSAETILFETLVLFSSFVGVIGSIYMKSVSYAGFVITLGFIVIMIIVMNYKYSTRLMALYKCVDTELVKDVKTTFDKAWMLHCFVDDIIEEGADLKETR